MAVDAHALPRLAPAHDRPTLRRAERTADEWRPKRRPMPPPPASTRKPLPRHILKQILDASNARLRWRDPMLLEMQARTRAKLKAERKAQADKKED